MLDNKKISLIHKILTVLCIVAIGVVLICDLAINKRLVWSMTVIVSVIFGWLVVSPVFLVKRNKLLYLLITVSIAILPFLFFLDKFTIITGWFRPLGLPIAIMSIVALWIDYALIRILKTNKWYLSAITVFIYGVLLSGGVRYFVNSYVGKSFFELDMIINTVSALLITVLLIFIGTNKKAEKNEEIKSDEI